MSDNDERILRDLESAASAVRKGIGGKAGESSEKKYGQAYNAAVTAGLKPKLKQKYR